MKDIILRLLAISETMVGGGGLAWSYILILTGLTGIIIGKYAGITGDMYMTTCGGVVGAGVSNFGASMNARKTSQAIAASNASGVDANASGIRNL